MMSLVFESFGKIGRLSSRKEVRMKTFTDKQRLDWLRGGDVRRSSTFPDEWHSTDNTNTGYYGKSPRAAIDAAINAERKAKPTGGTNG